MILRSLILICIFCKISFDACSQKTLFISPLIGIENPYCSLAKGKTTASTFKANYLDVGLNLGMLLRLQLNQNWTISTGISSGNIGWGFRVTTLKNNTFNPYRPPEHRTSEAIYYHRFPLMLTYNLKQVNGWNIHLEKPAKELNLFAFDLQATFGFSYNRVGALSYLEGSHGRSTTFLYGDNISYLMNYKVKQMSGASLIGGLGMQFYFKNKPGIHLLFYYSQGIFNVVDVTVDYELNGDKFSSKLRAKGSIVGVQMSYPIRVKRFGGKNS